MVNRGSLLQTAFSVRGAGFALVNPPEPVCSSPGTVCADRRCFISIIIPAHNEEGYIEHTLDVLRGQEYQPFEIIVVANGCKDGTVDSARGRCQRLVVLPQKSLGTARNLGGRVARGELLVFLDADTVLEPMALRRISETFSTQDAAGTLKGRPDGPRLAYRMIYALKNSIHRWSLHPGSSGVILCWKDQFLACGGFDEGLEMRENSELMKRLKRFGDYKYLGNITATTSMRRYERRGVTGTVWLWFRIWLQSLTGDLRQRRYETVR